MNPEPMRPDTIARQELSDQRAKFNGNADLEQQQAQLRDMAVQLRAKVQAARDGSVPMTHSERRMALESAGSYERDARDHSWFTNMVHGLTADKALEHPDSNAAEPSVARVARIKPSGED